MRGGRDWRRSVERLILLTGIALAAPSFACSQSHALPSFARPAAAEGFTELATGDAGEKESARFWLFGGNMSFASWRDGATSTFAAMQWNVDPDPSVSSYSSELLASSPDGKLCIGYYDLHASGSRFADHFREMMKLIAPDALEASTAFETVIYVSAGQCA